MTDRTADTVLLIHGLWMTPLAWEGWVERYERRGFRVLTPGYPGIGQGAHGVAALRDDPERIAGVGVADVLAALIDEIDSLDAPPIIMGHSFGGTFAQLLVGLGYGAAGVSIDGAGVKGVRSLPLSELRSTFPVLGNPANRTRSVGLTPRQFRYAFTNAQSDEVAAQAFERYAVPTPARILFEGGFANFTPHASTTFDFSDDDRAPLLFISGERDHILPPAVQRENYERNRRHSGATSAYAIFPGRDHFTCGAPGWEAVADLALDWAVTPTSGEVGSKAPAVVE